MNYYALQVKTRAEETFIKRASVPALPPEIGQLRLIFPRRQMPIRRKGIVHQVLEPVFPGYLFLEAESLKDVLYWHLRTTQGFYRFLPENKVPKPLEGRDLATLRHFMSFGDIADKSMVSFDDNDRIHVLTGPLKGLEGRIVKVDKRKGRAKVKLDMYDESFLVDLAFEMLVH